MATRKPSIPSVTHLDPNIRHVLAPMKENIEPSGTHIPGSPAQ